MRKLFFIFIFVVLLSGISSAETVYLKGGEKIDGKITTQTSDQIKIEVNGVARTYYMDEIDRIEGKSGEAATATQAPSSFEEIAPAAQASSSTTPTVSDKRQLVLKYIKVSGVKDSMERTFEKIIADAPEDQRAQLKGVLKIDDIIEQLIPIYGRYFTENDLKELILFYESPVGKKLLESAPLILKDSMETSIKYLENKIQ
jgi:uncharacterized protein